MINTSAILSITFIFNPFPKILNKYIIDFVNFYFFEFLIFFYFNLVGMIFGDMTVISRIIYALVGISGLWGIKLLFDD